ncbi:MAG TPA: hypothetical protein VF457_11850 [Burkholderiaceae bacterium]
MSIHKPSTLALAIAASLPVLAQAAPGADSAYMTDAQNTSVHDSTSQGVDQVNMITCVMSSMRPDALVNKGNYIALVDKNKCDTSSRTSASNSSDTSDSGSAPQYMSAVVNSTRTTDSDPMRVKAWIDNQEDKHDVTIFANVSVSAPPSDTNPYGVFRLDFCGKSTGLSDCVMQGYLQGATDGVSFYQSEMRGPGGGGGGGGGGGAGGGTDTVALRLQASNSDSGQGTMQMSGVDDMGNPQTQAFTFAYNGSYFLRHTDGVGDQCFSRDASDDATGVSVWSYGLYTADTGARVTRNSDFPIDYTDPSTHILYHGDMGYYGMWMQGNVDVPNGATVQRVQFNSDGSAPSTSAYTVMKAPGRLMKFTRQTTTLAKMDKLPVQVWVGDATSLYAGAQSNQQYQMYWDDTAGTFMVSGTVVCDSGPCENHDLDTPQPVSAAFFSSFGFNGWSQTLGGQVSIPPGTLTAHPDSATVQVAYRKQDLVYPADMPATLYCLGNCPTAASIGAYFATGSTANSPFVDSTFNNWMPTPAGGVVSYTTDPSTGMLVDGNDQPVSFTDATAAQQRPMYQQGVMTGRLFTDLASALCADHSGNYCDYQAEQMDVYYEWQTGPNQWNQFAALKDGSGNVVSFDPPLQVNYTVPTGARYGEFSGKPIVLQYAGWGDLWGIPGHCVAAETNATTSCDQPNVRYVPAFSIPFDQTLGVVQTTDGASTMLVKWLNREIRFAVKDVSVCTGAGITLPTGLALPDGTSLQNPTDSTAAVYIGDKPTVTDAPRVIQGVVEY